MSRTPEGKVKEKIKAILNELDIYWFCPRGTAFGRAGVPDFICCMEGAFVAIEAKAGANTPTALQRKELNSIVEHNGFSFVIYDHTVQYLGDTLRRLKRVLRKEETEALAEARAERDRIRSEVREKLLAQSNADVPSGK